MKFKDYFGNSTKRATVVMRPASKKITVTLHGPASKVGQKLKGTGFDPAGSKGQVYLFHKKFGVDDNVLTQKVSAASGILKAAGFETDVHGARQ